MNKQPQLMDLSRMRDILTPHLALISENIVFNGEVGMVHGDHTVFSLLMRQKPPFTINDHRFGIILSGEARLNFNLQDRHVPAGTQVKNTVLTRSASSRQASVSPSSPSNRSTTAW